MNTRHFDFTRRPKAKSVCSDRWHDLTVVIYGTILRVVYFNRTTRTTVSNSSCMRLGRSHTSQWCSENQPFLFRPNLDISTPHTPLGGPQTVVPLVLAPVLWRGQCSSKCRRSFPRAGGTRSRGPHHPDSIWRLGWVGGCVCDFIACLLLCACVEGSVLTWHADNLAWLRMRW